MKSDHYFGSWSGKPQVAGKAEEIAQDLDPDASKRLSAGEGTKGARLHDWAYCELADLDADEYDETKSGAWTRGLLIRRNISDGDPDERSAALATKWELALVSSSKQAMGSLTSATVFTLAILA